MSNNFDGRSCSATVQGPRQTWVYAGTVSDGPATGTPLIVGTVEGVCAFTDGSTVTAAWSGVVETDGLDDVLLGLYLGTFESGVNLRFWDFSGVASVGDLSVPVSVDFQLDPLDLAGAVLNFYALLD